MKQWNKDDLILFYYGELEQSQNREIRNELAVSNSLQQEYAELCDFLDNQTRFDVPAADANLNQRIMAPIFQQRERERNSKASVRKPFKLSEWLTYAYPAWAAIPYLAIGGPLGSGKSRVFEVLSRIVYRPLPSANITAPCMFRTLDAQGGTLLLDEAERLHERTPGVGEIRSILMSGYKAGNPARRLEANRDWRMSFWPTR